MNLDTPTKERFKLLYPDFAQRVMNIYSYIFDTFALQMRCTDGYRSVEDQDNLYAKGRTIPGQIITNSKGGSSYHNFGLAVDSCFIGTDPYLKNHPNGENIWAQFGARCKLEGLTWGGDFIKLIDIDHVECSYGNKLSELRSMYQDGGITNVWAHLQNSEGQNATA